MQTSDISIWGAVVLLLLTGMAASLYLLVDRRLGQRMGRALMAGTLQLVALSALTWGLYTANRWWADLLWLLAAMVVVTTLLLRQLHWGGSRLFLPLAGALTIGTVAVGACMLWVLTARQPYLTHHLLIPVGAMLLAHQLVSVKRGMQTYLGSLQHTTAHRHYLLACGATHLESVLPSARRALRAAILPSLQTLSAPIVIAMPLLFAGMLLCGASPWAAAIVTWLMQMAAFAVTILTLVLVFWLSDRWLFDPQDNLLLGV